MIWWLLLSLLLLSLMVNAVLFMVLVCGRTNEPVQPRVDHNPYQEGRECYLAERDYDQIRNCQQYPPRSDDRVLWIQGFNAAYREDVQATSTCL